MRGSFGRRVVKSALAGALYYSGTLRAIERLRTATWGARAHIYGYHRVVADFEEAAAKAIPALSISVSAFRKQVELIGRRYEIVPFETALDVLAGRLRPRRDVATLTFDDGYRDVHTHAAPILRTLGIPATVFVPTGYVGAARALPHDRLYELLGRAAGRHGLELAGGAQGPTQRTLLALLEASRLDGPAAATDRAVSTLPAAVLRETLDILELALGPASPAVGGEGVMSWTELRDLARGGFEIGSHTVGHVVLTEAAPGVLTRELEDSKHEIERNLGVRVRYFAYPNGRYSGAVIAALARAGYLAAVTTEDLPNLPGGNPFALRRKVLWENHGRGLFGRFSAPLAASHIADAFGTLGLRKVQRGESQPRAGTEGVVSMLGLA